MGGTAGCRQITTAKKKYCSDANLIRESPIKSFDLQFPYWTICHSTIIKIACRTSKLAEIWNREILK